MRTVLPALLIAMPLLVAIFDGVGIFGAQMVGVGLLKVESGAFWSQMQASVGQADVSEGLAKSLKAAPGSSLTLLASTTDGALNALDVRVKAVSGGVRLKLPIPGIRVKTAEPTPEACKFLA